MPWILHTVAVRIEFPSAPPFPPCNINIQREKRSFGAKLGRGRLPPYLSMSASPFPLPLSIYV